MCTEGPGQPYPVPPPRSVASESPLRGATSESRPWQVRELLSPAALDGVAAIYASGLARFPTSPLLHVAAAQFFALLRGNRCVRACIAARIRCIRRSSLHTMLLPD